MRFVQRGLLWLFAFCAAPALSWAQAVPNNSCLTCHADMVEDMKGSVHYQHQIYCQNCHGGDPAKADKESAKAEGTGYIGVPDKKQLVKVCGECHADVEKMNFYGIRTDQLARYKTSVHGKKLFGEGNVRVAACTDCHGYHDVVAVTDPNSPVYPSNIPKTCNQCHGNEKLMSTYGLPSDIFKKYEGSVHGKALFEKKDASVAQCASCHGSHGAVPPGVKDVANTCGKCHINEEKYFTESVHASIADKEKFNGCISCHSDHGIQPPTPGLYDTACVKCHEANSPALAQAHELQRLVRTAQEGLEKTQALVKQAAIDGLFVDEETASLEEAKTNVIAMAPMQHTLAEAKIAELNDKAATAFKGIEESINAKRHGLKARKMFLGPLWIFVFIMMVALWLRYKQLKGGHKKESDG